MMLFIIEFVSITICGAVDFMALLAFLISVAIKACFPFAPLRPT